MLCNSFVLGGVVPMWWQGSSRLAARSWVSTGGLPLLGLGWVSFPVRVRDVNSKRAALQGGPFAGSAR